MNYDTSDNGMPFISSFPVDDTLPWQMSRSEKYGLIGLLEDLKPDYSLEIGTFRGGSLQVISRFSNHVFSIDISPEPKRTLEKRFHNVEFIVGNSIDVIHSTIQRIEAHGGKLNFVLIDGDHSRKGVYNDLKAVLDYEHKNDLTILMHDSYNPECRKGMKDVDFTKYDNIEYVELDYITGSFWHNNNNREMWGGLAMIKLKTDPCDNPKVHESAVKSFEVSRLHSSHIIKDSLWFLKPFKRWLYRKLNLKHPLDELYDFDDK